MCAAHLFCLPVLVADMANYNELCKLVHGQQYRQLFF